MNESLNGPLLTIHSVDMATLLSTLEEEISLDRSMPVTLNGGDLVAVRKYEVAAALSRLRGLHVA
jgi:hypothetical protein